MKILLATFWVVPHVGGVWNYMLQLKKNLELLGNEVDLLGYGEGNNYVHIVNQNRSIDVKKPKLFKQSQPSPYKDPVVKYYEMKRYGYEHGVNELGLEKYDLIHTQDVLSTVSINRIRPEKTVLVATLHGCVAHELRHYLLNVNKTDTSQVACKYFDELEYDGATSADMTVVANEWMKNILTNEFQVPNEQIRLSHYGYDIEQFDAKMKQKSPVENQTDKKLIIYAGRITELKGVNYLISALKELSNSRNDWICWIVGEGDKLTEIKKQSKTLSLEKDVIFMGNRDDVPYLLSISDIFVLPSLIENQPLSVIEAQIAGKAVIISDAGGLPEMVDHGKTGVITLARNASNLSTNINYLLEHQSYRESLGINARKWALTHWSQSEAVKRVLEIYQSAMLKKYKNIR